MASAGERFFIGLAALFGGYIGFGLHQLVLGFTVFAMTFKQWNNLNSVFWVAPLALVFVMSLGYWQRLREFTYFAIGLMAFVTQFAAFFAAFFGGGSLLFALRGVLPLDLRFIFILGINLILSILFLSKVISFVERR